MFERVVVSIFDNVCHDFLNGEVSGENHVVTDALLLSRNRVAGSAAAR